MPCGMQFIKSIMSVKAKQPRAVPVAALTAIMCFDGGQVRKARGYYVRWTQVLLFVELVRWICLKFWCPWLKDGGFGCLWRGYV